MAASADGYPASASTDVLVATNLPPSAADADAVLPPFLREVEEKRSQSQKSFAGDAATASLFDQLFVKLPDVGRLCLRGSGLARIRLANDILLPEVALPEKLPRYSIRIEQTDQGTDDKVVYFKRLFGGWCVKIERDTFEALAYGADGALPDKAYEKLHMLCVRGGVKMPFSELSRFCITVACEDKLHEERNRMRDQRLQERDDKACQFGLTMMPAGGREMESLELTELEVAVDDASVTTTSCAVSIEQVAAENMARIEANFRFGLERLAFSDKLEYWSALRSGDATSQKLLVNLFDAALKGSGAKDQKGAGVFEGAQVLCENYIRSYQGLSREEIVNRLVAYQAGLNLSSGFVTGFGGFMTMAITVPAGLLATWITSARLAFAVAHAYGHDIYQPCVANAVLYCLTGSIDGDGKDKKESEEALRNRLHECIEQRDGEQAAADAGSFAASGADSFAGPASSTPDHGGGRARGESGYEDLGSFLGAPSPSSPSSPPEDTEDLMAYTAQGSLSKTFQEKYETLYDLLGVEQTATQQEIRVAYRKKALKYHPDKMNADMRADPKQVEAATVRFQVLAAAYEELGDPDRRADYDAKLRKGDWSWTDLSWDGGLERARNAFMTATEKLGKSLPAGQVASRAITQVAVDLVEVSTVGAMARAGGAMELRTSIVAGEKLAATASARASSRIIPVIGAFISGAIDCAMTASVGRCAVRIFKR